MSHIIPLDLWGGHTSFDTESLTFILNRPYGLFSNITVALYGICKIKSLGYNVENIDFYLAEYENQYNFYNDLFYKKSLNEKELISVEEANIFMNTIHPTSHGLSRGWNKFVSDDLMSIMNIIKKMYNHYFANNAYVYNTYQEIINDNNINYKNSAFVWARKTDKINETEMPSAQKYIETLSRYSVENIYIQTDDPSVISDFNELKDSRIYYLRSIPMSTTENKGFHQHLYMVDSNDFIKEYGLSKVNYLRKILATTMIASNCDYFVCYPGNLTTMIPIIRGSFKNCILFSNSTDLVD